MQRYNFYEFSGYQLIERLQKTGNAPIDFSTRTRKSLAGVIKSVDEHNDNAMFYQTRRCLENMAGDFEDFKRLVSDWNSNSLKNILIYIDFSGVFPAEQYAGRKFHPTERQTEQERDEQIRQCEEITETFFRHGFDIQFGGDIGCVHYVPFEKSASMARAAEMLFADARLYHDLEQRIRLGLDFSKTEVSASKVYAYTGLYLSDAKRIRETPDFALNEETVVILPDNVNNDGVVADGAISGFDPKEKEGLEDWTIKRAGKFTTEINYFDGEGLISPEYCAAVNDILHSEYGMTGTAASIQIRLPFTKGMLHNVDFHKFICEKLNIRSCEDVWILDVYHKKRNLAKAQIILMQSMFKACKWLSNGKISGLAKEDDPVKLYFERFHRYDHALYVGNTDMNLSQAGKTKLNYQFLNTLALTDADFEEIASEQLRLAGAAPAKRLIREISNERLERKAAFDDAADDYGEDNWKAAAGRNPAFLNDPKVQGMLKGVRYSMLKDVGRGKLTVSGSVKYLSRDLLAFLAFMIGKIEPKGTLTKAQIGQIRHDIKRNELRRTKFFAADCVPKNPVFAQGGRPLHLQSKRYYGLLRNPHLSRNEQCSLRPFIPKKEDIYVRYFGHLKGIVMIPMGSFAAQALGGADFDGDMVKIITDPRVNRAINEACYYADAEGSTEKHRRKLPVVMIPATHPRTIKLPAETVDFRTLQDTFSSKVGQISNRAITLGKHEYDAKNPDPAYDLKCETCTILVGLEIDAAKTGRHPYLGGILKSGEKDYFVARKEEIDRLPEQFRFKIEEYPAAGSPKGHGMRSRLCAEVKGGPNMGDALMTAENPEDAEGSYRIDRLPFMFLEGMRDYAEMPAPKKEDTGTRFSFEKDPDWKKELAESKKKETRELILSYRHILETAHNVYWKEKRLRKSNYVGCIHTIFRIQYEGIADEAEITAMQEDVFLKIMERLDSYQSAETALEKLVKDRKWQFCGTDAEKDRYMEEILPGNGGDMKDAKKALYNFRWNGYELLYYYIKDIMLTYREAETELQILQGESQGSDEVSKGSYYEEFRRIYEAALHDKESKKIWNRRIIERCRTVLKKIFAGRADTAIQYVCALRRDDPNGTFFWDIFTTKEILQETEVFSDVK